MGGVIDGLEASLLMIDVGGDCFVDLSLLLSLALLIGRVAGDGVVVVADGGDATGAAGAGAGAGAGDSFVIGVFVVGDVVVIVVVGCSTVTGGGDSFVSDASGLVDGVVVAGVGVGDGDEVFDDVTVISAA